LSGVFVNAYVDESGKVFSPAMVICGYVAPWSVWNSFQDNYFCREGYRGYLANPNAASSEIYSRLAARTNFKALAFDEKLLGAIAKAGPISHLEFVRSEYLKQQPINIVKSQDSS
jgi:hypothetical protein